ncbi:MAG: helix-hairpin-helix domain-containing protein [Saprospiraceae bacterium]|nr:helix-hairpin-helix domain-containing protein [Saprospiraceae bacterium]
MKSSAANCLFAILFLCTCVDLSASETGLVLLRPTGQRVDGLIEMEIIDSLSPLAVRMHEIVSKSVVKDFLDIHEILQIYLFNTMGKSIEPAYLALTQNQGGYARKGFILNLGDRHQRMENSYYVDIIESTVDRDYNSLMSITQLYPHELGHIMYRLLSSSDSISESSKNVDVHYFSVTTDYQIAFNEGFAEHLENIARLFENNPKVVEGIIADTTEIARKSHKAIKGFTKDFEYPFRFGFYKMTMLAWYQTFEDYKRFVYAMNGTAKFANASISTSSRQNNLIYRNAGVAFEKNELRNKVQLLSTEGTVSAFFSLLSQTDLKERYQPISFYKAFVRDSSESFVPDQKFTSLQNLFIKYFHVLDSYVQLEQTEKAQLIDFIDGYLIEFPEEAHVLLDVYRDATGMDYSNAMPPPVWLLLKDQPHGVLALDAYAGLTVSFYTFELNAAEVEDLMMIKGVSEEDAEIILAYRKEHGLLNHINEVKNIEGLTAKGRQAVLSAQFDQDYFDKQEFLDGLSIKSVIRAPLKYLAAYTLIYFAILMTIYLFLINHIRLSRKKIMGHVTGYLILWLIFVLFGLVIAASSWHWALVLIPAVAAILLTGLIDKSMQRRRILLVGMMTLIILVSLV